MERVVYNYYVCALHFTPNLKEQKMNNEQFAAFYGSIIRALAIVKRPLHVVSFLAATWYFYGVFSNQLDSFGLAEIYAFTLIAYALTVLAPLLLEYLHFYVPATFFRMLYRPKMVWDGGFKSIAMFIFVGVLLVSLTVFSQHTSSEGGRMAAQHRKETGPQPSKDDLSSDSINYANQSSLLSVQYDEQIAAKQASKAAAKKSAIASYEAKISELSSALRQHQSDLKKGNVWARSWIDKRNNEIATLKSAKQTAFQSAGIEYDAEIAELRNAKATALLSANASWATIRETANQGYQQRKSDFDNKMNDLANFAHGVGFWVVILIVICDALITFYELHSGREFVGAEWKSSNAMSRLFSVVGGVFSDKLYHVLVRSEATREALNKRNTNEPYKLPSSRSFIRAFAVVLIVFAGFQLPDIPNSVFAEFSLIPSPWNWPFALFSVVVGVLTFWNRPINQRESQQVRATSQQSETSQRGNAYADIIPDNADNSSDLDAEKYAETRLAGSNQQNQQNADIAPPPPMSADPGNTGGLNDEWIAYRKRVYSWWATAKNKKKPKATRDANEARCYEAFPNFEKVGYEAEIKGNKLSIKKKQPA